MQVCSVCKEEKPFTEYHKNKNYKTGYSVTCKPCAVIRAHRWQTENKDRVNEGLRKNYYLHHDRYLTNHKVRQKRWLDKPGNTEKMRQKSRAWAKANPEAKRLAENKRRALKVSNGVFFISRKDLARLLASSCHNCGSQNSITLDHVIPISRGGRHSVGNLQPLCRSCNSSKNNRTMTEWKHSKRMLGVG
jgi:5-methylcytosine-specific restriction endonuclease McrA